MKTYLVFLIGVLLIALGCGIYFLVRDPEYFGVNTQFKRKEVLEETPEFPIDVVYTWAGPLDGGVRERDNNELKYSLRSLFENLPWVNHIYILMNPPLRLPDWMDEGELAANNVTLLDHTMLIDDGLGKLPVGTRHSRAIETNIPNIPGLSEHFIYMNDDFMVNRRIPVSGFFDGRKIKVPRGIERHVDKDGVMTHGWYSHVPIPMTKTVIQSYNSENKDFIKIIRAAKKRRNLPEQMQGRWAMWAIRNGKSAYSDNMKNHRLPCEKGYYEAWCQAFYVPSKEDFADYFVVNDSSLSTKNKITDLLENLFPHPSPIENQG